MTESSPAEDTPEEPFDDEQFARSVSAYLMADEDGGAVWAAPADGRGDALLDLTHPERSDLINVMTPDEIKVLLAHIAGNAPEVFDQALADRSETFADELFGWIKERDQAEYMAERDGYCTVCGENVSWFLGYEGPQHFRGPHKLVTGSERRELFDAGHEPAIAWREARAVDPPAGTVLPAELRDRMGVGQPVDRPGDQWGAPEVCVCGHLVAAHTGAAAVLGDYQNGAGTADPNELSLCAARLADALSRVLAVLDDCDQAAAQFPAAAVQLAQIHLVIEAFDWETDDRQYALEQIDQIVNGGAA